MYVWLNGAFVGYAEDSFTPSEFDVTPWIWEKGNRLAVESFAREERQAGLWIRLFPFSGNFRDVYLTMGYLMSISRTYL